MLWLCMFALAVGAHSTGVFYLPSAYFELQRMRLIGGAMAHAIAWRGDGLLFAGLIAISILTPCHSPKIASVP